MVKTMSLRLPDEMDKKLEKAIVKGMAITKTELIRRAIAEFIDHPGEQHNNFGLIFSNFTKIGRVCKFVSQNCSNMIFIFLQGFVNQVKHTQISAWQ